MASYSQMQTIRDENQIGLIYLIRNDFPKKYIERALNNVEIRIDYQNSNGDTALHVAVNKGNNEIVELLINRGANAKTRNNEQKSSFDLINEKLQSSDSLNWSLIHTSLKRGHTSSSLADLAPSPKKPKTETTYDAAGLKHNIHGPIYQMKLLALFAHRAKKEGLMPFRIATEMTAADKLDDVVFQYTNRDSKDPFKETWSFSQIKHKKEPEKNLVKVKDLFSTSNEGDFDLQKYFVSFCKIKHSHWFQNDHLKDFLIITNTNLDSAESANSQHHVNSLEISDIFKVENNLNEDRILYFSEENFAAEKYKFNVDKKQVLKKVMKTNLLETSLIEIIIGSLSKELTETIQAFKIVHFEQKITKDVKDVIGEIESVFNKKRNKTRFSKAVNKMLSTIEGVFNKEKCEILRTARNNLEESRLDGTEDTVIHELERDVLSEVRKLSDEVNESLEAAKIQLERYNDPTPDLSEELTNTIKNELQKIANSFNLEKIRDDLKPKLGSLISEKLIVYNKNFDELFDEFFDKFHFITNYPNEEHLGMLIHNELGKLFNLLRPDFLGDKFEKEMLNFLKNYKNGLAVFYTSDDVNRFFDELYGQLNTLLAVGDTIYGYISKLRKYKISFIKDLEKLRRFVLSESQIFHVSTPTTRLSAIRVLRTLEHFEQFENIDSLLFTSLDEFLEGENSTNDMYTGKQKMILTAFKKEQTHNLLVIECQEKKKTDKSYLENISKLHHSLRKILENNQSKKVILIAQKNDAFIKNFQLTGVNTYEDTTSFIDLDDASKDRQLVKEEKINFQGNRTELETLIDRESAEQVFDQGILSKFIEDVIMAVGDKKAFTCTEYVKKCYFEREFQLQKLKTEILKQHKLFYITGANKDDLVGLGVERNNIFTYSSEAKYKRGIIIPPSDQSGNINKMYQTYKSLGKTAHWIVYRRHLFCKISASNFKFMMRFIDHNYVASDEDEADGMTILEEEDFCTADSLSHKAVIVTNEPGSGKSTVLVSVANKLKDFSDDTFWIVRINLNDFSELKKKPSLNDIDFGHTDIADAIEFLTKMAIPGRSDKSPTTRFQHNLLKVGLVNTPSAAKRPKLLIIFDGFDEICPGHKEKTIELIKALMKSRVIQIWVTTRDNQKAYLEQQLETAAYVLRPLSEPNQIVYASNYWKWDLIYYWKGNARRKRDYGDIVNYLKEAESNTKQLHEQNLSNSISKILNDFPEDKTQTNTNSPKYKQLTDTIDDDEKLNFSTYIKELNDRLKESTKDRGMQFTANALHLKMLTDVVFNKKFQLSSDFRLFDLFDNFVNIKFDIFYEHKERRRTGRPAADQTRESYSKTLRNDYNAIAVDFFFGKELKGRKHGLPNVKLKRFKEQQKQEHVGIGLITINDNQTEFMHRSYAEYFLSKYLFDNQKHTLVQSLIDKINTHIEYESIRQFYNDQKASQDVELNQSL